ncbi:hypothetical protein GQ457_02G026890 [Hibiscus cannabinus]
MAGTSTKRLRKFCIFAGSYPGKDEYFENAAKKLGEVMVKQKYEVIYGGGCMGLMGAVAATALVGGSSVLGIVPTTWSHLCGATIGKEVRVNSIQERIALMMHSSDAFIALPGGIGTLEEIVCVTSWSSLTRNKKPIGLLNINGYFDSLLCFLDNAVTNGFMFTEIRRILIYAATIEELFEKLQAFKCFPDINESILGKRKIDDDKRDLDCSLSL